MHGSPSKDNDAEVEFQATLAARVQVKATGADVVARYRECRNWRIYWKEYVFKLVRDCRPRNILDFGCGSGESSTELAALGYDVLGIDLSPDLIALAEERARLDGVTDRAKFLVVDGSCAELPKGAYDLVVVLAVLHHVDLAATLRVIDEALSPTGFLVIAEPVAYSKTLQWLRDRSPVEKEVSPNERQLHQGDMREIAERFQVVSKQHFNIVQRLHRLVPGPGAIYDRVLPALSWIDSLLLKIPGMSHFAATVILLCRRRAGSASS